MALRRLLDASRAAQHDALQVGCRSGPADVARAGTLKPSVHSSCGLRLSPPPRTPSLTRPGSAFANSGSGAPFRGSVQTDRPRTSRTHLSAAPAGLRAFPHKPQARRAAAAHEPPRRLRTIRPSSTFQAAAAQCPQRRLRGTAHLPAALICGEFDGAVRPWPRMCRIFSEG